MVKAKQKGAAAVAADIQAKASQLSPAAQVIMCGDCPVAVYDTVYNGRHTFRLHKLWFDSRAGEWRFDKPLMIPFEYRAALLNGLVSYAKAVS